MKIGLTKFQVDDRAALALEFFGAGENSQRTLAIQL